MEKSDEDRKKLLALLQRGIYVQSIILMIQKSFLLNKVDLQKKITEFSVDFFATLTAEEKNDFAFELKALIEERIKDYEKELSKDFSKKEVKEILKELTKAE